MIDLANLASSSSMGCGVCRELEKNIAYLAQNHRVLALDLPGFGRSDKPDVRYSIPYWAAFMQKFMRVLEIDRAALVGESIFFISGLQISHTP